MIHSTKGIDAFYKRHRIKIAHLIQKDYEEI